MNKDSAVAAVTTVTKTVSYTTATLLLVSLNVAAAGLHQNINRIEPNTLNNASGSIGVNIAAGDNNIQANTKSIAIGKNAQAINKSHMSTQALNNTGTASVSIGANTLQNAKGLISVNQVSGSGNAQLNAITLAFGENSQVISDSLLMVRSSENNNSNSSESSIGKNTIYLDKNSLNGATGTIQINQIAGNGNIAVNRVSMPVP